MKFIGEKPLADRADILHISRTERVPYRIGAVPAFK